MEERQRRRCIHPFVPPSPSIIFICNIDSLETYGYLRIRQGVFWSAAPPQASSGRRQRGRSRSRGGCDRGHGARTSRGKKRVLCCFLLLLLAILFIHKQRLRSSYELCICLSYVSSTSTLWTLLQVAYFNELCTRPLILIIHPLYIYRHNTHIHTLPRIPTGRPYRVMSLPSSRHIQQLLHTAAAALPLPRDRAVPLAVPLPADCCQHQQQQQQQQRGPILVSVAHKTHPFRIPAAAQQRCAVHPTLFSVRG